MTKLINVISLTGFAATLYSRMIDPIILPIAGDLGVAPATVALLATGFAIPFGLVQPILGPTADTLGKVRVMIVCLLALALTAFVGAMAPNFTTLSMARVAAGVAAGGVTPVAIALIGDLVPVEARQVVLGRYLAVTMSGNLFGALAAGIIGDLLGWRTVFLCMGCCTVATAAWASVGLIGITDISPQKLTIVSAARTYRTILGSRSSRIWYGAVFLEGIAIFGSFPYVASLLANQGEMRTSVAGLVLAGFALGSILYARTVRVLLCWLLLSRIVMIGGALAALALVAVTMGLPWQIGGVIFTIMGFGFYMLHGSIQVQVTEISQVSRASAMALHSFFFAFGHGVGPVLYGIGLSCAGIHATFAGGAVTILVTAWLCSRAIGVREESA